jgi:hypothetical protein
MTNAQVASLGSIAAGILLILWARRHSTTASTTEVLRVEAASRH